MNACTLTLMTIRVWFQVIKVKFNINTKLVRDDCKLSPFQYNQKLCKIIIGFTVIWLLLVLTSVLIDVLILTFV